MRYGFVLGNGITRLPGIANRQAASISWDDLMDDLAFHLNTEINPTTPLPFEFDRLATKLLQDKPKYERLFRHDGYDDAFKQLISQGDPLLGIKRYIAAKFNEKDFVPLSGIFNSFMQKVGNAKPTVLLTTNYDCRIERQIDKEYQPGKLTSFDSTESLSPTMSHGSSGVVCYHCHGTIEAPATICLGYGDYARIIASIENIYDRLDAGYIKSDEELWPLRFVDTNLAIIGLTLDYSEIDLWHLLARRARYFALHPDRSENTILFIDASPRSTRANDSKTLYRKQNLRNLGVKVINVSGTDYETCYERAVGVVQDEWTGCWLY